MKSGRIIDVSKASIVSLKAELVKKQEEALKIKSTGSYIRPLPKAKRLPKVNPGIEERRLKDEITQEEVDLLAKSREVLEVKSKLYDKLQTGESVQEKVGDPYLVDFKEKLDKVFNESQKTPENTGDLEETTLCSDSDDDGWVDYVDCFGRSRRCLKEDFKEIKTKDDEMRQMLGGDVDCNTEPEQIKEEPTEQQLEMISSEMQREKMREKWEQQEQTLLNKKNIYYEDVRFDEARSHGVAYFGFSTDESKREEEQAEFKRLRDETVAKQKETREAKERRDLLKQSRLMAARQRQRARLGLPPLLVDDTETSYIVKEDEPEIAETKVEDLEAALSRAAHVRPWDIGKDGVKQPAKVLNQEEWIEKKREERPDEFAPPLLEEKDLYIPKKKGKKNKSFRENNRKDFIYQHDKDTLNTLPEPNWNTESNSVLLNDQTEHEKKVLLKRGAAIPPPASFDYYTPNKKPQYSSKKYCGSSSKGMIESIEAGLDFLKKQSERRDKLVEKNKFSDG